MRQLLKGHNQPNCKWKHNELEGPQGSLSSSLPYQSRQDRAMDIPSAYGFLLNLICSLGICQT